MTTIDPDSRPTGCMLEEDALAGQAAGQLVIPPDVLPMPCGGCGRRVMTSPSTRALVRRGLTRPACPSCMTAWAKAQDTVIVALVLPAEQDPERN